MRDREFYPNVFSPRGVLLRPESHSAGLPSCLSPQPTPMPFRERPQAGAAPGRRGRWQRSPGRRRRSGSSSESTSPAATAAPAFLEDGFLATPPRAARSPPRAARSPPRAARSPPRAAQSPTAFPTPAPAAASDDEWSSSSSEDEYEHPPLRVKFATQFCDHEGGAPHARRTRDSNGCTHLVQHRCDGVFYLVRVVNAMGDEQQVLPPDQVPECRAWKVLQVEHRGHLLGLALFDVWSKRGRHYFRLERPLLQPASTLVPCGARQVDEAVVRNFAEYVGNAIRELHESGIVHGNVTLDAAVAARRLGLQHWEPGGLVFKVAAMESARFVSDDDIASRMEDWAMLGVSTLELSGSLDPAIARSLRKQARSCAASSLLQDYPTLVEASGATGELAAGLYAMLSGRCPDFCSRRLAKTADTQLMEDMNMRLVWLRNLEKNLLSELDGVERQQPTAP